MKLCTDAFCDELYFIYEIANDLIQFFWIVIKNKVVAVRDFFDSHAAFTKFRNV